MRTELYNTTKELLKDLAEYNKSSHSEKSAKNLEVKGVNAITLSERCNDTKSRYFYLEPSSEFRWRHIAMSEFRGKQRDEIEKPHESNRLPAHYESKIAGLKTALEEEQRSYVEQKTLCSNSQ